MSFLSSILNFFKKIWDFIKKVLVYVLIACAVFIALWAVFATGGALLPFLGVAFTTTQSVVAALACLAGAFLIDKDTAKQVTGSVADAVRSATEAAANVATSAAGGAVSGILSSNLFMYALIGLGAYLLITHDKSKDNRTPTVGLDPKPDSTRPGVTGGTIYA